jgi:hypothetical protein
MPASRSASLYHYYFRRRSPPQANSFGRSLALDFLVSTIRVLSFVCRTATTFSYFGLVWEGAYEIIKRVLLDVSPIPFSNDNRTGAVVGSIGAV